MQKLTSWDEKNPPVPRAAGDIDGDNPVMRESVGVDAGIFDDRAPLVDFRLQMFGQ